MKILIVYTHPEPKSMNAAMFSVATETLMNAGHEVRTSDLYATQFEAISDRTNFASVHDAVFFKQQLEEMHATKENGFAADLEAEQQKVEWCDLMIWQFPLWWFSVPGVLKGWVDRVFAMGRFYGSGHTYETGVFRGKKALLSLTTGGGPADYLPGGANGDLTAILRPLQRGILEFTGFSVLQPQVVYGPARKSQEERVYELDIWKNRLEHVFYELPIVVGNY